MAEKREEIVAKPQPDVDSYESAWYGEILIAVLVEVADDDCSRIAAQGGDRRLSRVDKKSGAST